MSFAKAFPDERTETIRADNTRDLSTPSHPAQRVGRVRTGPAGRNGVRVRRTLMIRFDSVDGVDLVDVVRRYDKHILRRLRSPSDDIQNLIVCRGAESVGTKSDARYAY